MVADLPNVICYRLKQMRECYVGFSALICRLRLTAEHHVFIALDCRLQRDRQRLTFDWWRHQSHEPLHMSSASFWRLMWKDRLLGERSSMECSFWEDWLMNFDWDGKKSEKYVRKMGKTPKTWKKICGIWCGKKEAMPRRKLRSCRKDNTSEVAWREVDKTMPVWGKGLNVTCIICNSCIAQQISHQPNK